MNNWGRLGCWVGGFGLLLAAVVWGIGAMLPHTWRAEVAVRIEAPPAAVQREVADLPHWTHWSVWNRRNLEGLKTSEAGPDRVIWEAPHLGRMEIERAEPGAGKSGSAGSGIFRYRVRFSGRDAVVEGRFEWEGIDEGRATRLVWRQEGGLAGRSVARWTGLLLLRVFARADMRESLASLKERLER